MVPPRQIIIVPAHANEASLQLVSTHGPIRRHILLPLGKACVFLLICTLFTWLLGSIGVIGTCLITALLLLDLINLLIEFVLCEVQARSNK